MNRKRQNENAIKFRDLHSSGLFYLPNAHNGGSAKIFEKHNFKAIATTSAGIAYSMGCSDGEQIDFEDLKRVTKEIIKATNLPLSVDMERGYSESLSEVRGHVKEIISLGVVGINIEDGIVDEKKVDEMCDFVDKIQMISKLRNELDVDFVINARTDIFLLEAYEEENRLNEVVKRASALEVAGADCIFIPGALDEKTIRELRERIAMPINLFVHSAFHDTKILSEIGINRLSSGSAPVRTALNALKEVANDFAKGQCFTMLEHDFDYKSANNYFSQWKAVKRNCADKDMYII